MFLVAAVLVLNDDGRVPALLESLLIVVAPELTLDQNSCLCHLLVVSILKNCAKIWIVSCDLSSGLPTRSDTNWAVKPQRMARGLKF